MIALIYFLQSDMQKQSPRPTVLGVEAAAVTTSRQPLHGIVFGLQLQPEDCVRCVMDKCCVLGPHGWDSSQHMPMMFLIRSSSGCSLLCIRHATLASILRAFRLPLRALLPQHPCAPLHQTRS